MENGGKEHSATFVACRAFRTSTLQGKYTDGNFPVCLPSRPPNKCPNRKADRALHNCPPAQEIKASQAKC